jgi:hypothetical protein
VSFVLDITRPVVVAAALVAGVAPATAAARTSAVTHRFAPAADVTVSFKLPKHRTSGQLLRFETNRVSVVRSRSGTLRLIVKRRHSKGVRVSRRGSRRVVVTLSGTSGRVKLKVGGKAVSLRGKFVAESAVAVRKGAVVSLRITTGGNRTPITMVVPPAPGAALPAGTARFFAPDSVWNAPLPDDAALDPANATLVKTLQDTVTANVAARTGPWISTSDTPPLYTVPASQPTVRVELDPGSWKVGLQEAFASVPIPASARPGPAPDSQLTIWQPSTNRLWELFEARSAADGWHASFGGAMSNTSQSAGYFDTSSWPGLSQPWWGATATSLPAIGGTIMIDELKAGLIPHALAIAVPWAKPNVYSWPAQRTDGASSDPNAIPEGARFRIDPKLDIDSLNLPPMTRMMAKAAQRYGMIVRDQTGHAVGFYAENPSPYGADPYIGPAGFYNGPDPSGVMQAFPWGHVQLVKMDLRTMP